MIYYFPFAKIKFSSPLSDDEVVNQLVKNLEPKKYRLTPFFMNPEYHKQYEGKYFNYHFIMNWVLKNTKITNPEIEGRIIQNALNTSIHVKMKYKGLNATFLFMLSLILSIVFVIFLGVIITKGENITGNLKPIIACIIIYSIVMLRFNWTVYKVKQELSEFFKAKIDL